MKANQHKPDSITKEIAQGIIDTAPQRGMGDNFPPPATMEELKAMAAEDVYKLGTDTILAIVKAEVAIDSQDLTTAAGRALIKSKAHSVSTLKSNLVDKGMKLTEGWRNETKKVNAIKTDLETKLDALRDATREPVTKWEENDTNRIKGHQDAFKSVQDMMLFPAEISSGDVQLRIDMLKTLSERNFEEFEPSAKVEIAKASGILNDKLTAVLKSEADAKELEELRQNAAIQKQKNAEAEANKERETLMDKLITDMKNLLVDSEKPDLKMLGERKIEVMRIYRSFNDWRDREEEASKLADSIYGTLHSLYEQKANAEKNAKDKQEAETKRINILTGGILTMKSLLQGAADLPSATLAARKEQVTTFYKAIPDWKEYAKEARQVSDDVFSALDAHYALNLKKEKDAQKAKDKEISDKAAETERARIQAEQDKEQAELEKREANKKHVAKINKETANHMVDCGGIDFEDALAIVQAIGRGEIPNAQINY